MNAKFEDDLDAIVINTGKLLGEASLQEYAPGQPRQKNGRFDSNRGGGGGGGAVSPAEVISQTAATGGATLPTRIDMNEFALDEVVVAGEQPKSGYAVATGIAGRVVSADAFFDKQQGSVILDKFLADNAKHFENPAHHLGVWHDTKTGRVHLDITEVFPAGQRRVAVQAGRDRDQISIFNLKTFKEIPTGGKGGVQESASGQGSREHRDDDARGATEGRGADVGEVVGNAFGEPTARPEPASVGRNPGQQKLQGLTESELIAEFARRRVNWDGC